MNAESVELRRGRPAGVRPARVRLRTAGVAAAVAATLLTSACAAGRAAQTADQVPTQDGVNATVRNIALRGLSIEAPAASYYRPGSDVVVNVVLVNTGTTDDALTGITTSAASGWGSYASVADATLVQGEANNPTLASSSASATPSAPASPTTTTTTKHRKKHRSGSAGPSASTSAPAPQASQNVPIAAGERVSYGVPDATGELLLTSTIGRLYPGNSVTLDFTFAHAGDIKVIVPIQLSGNPGDQSVAAPATDAGD